MYPEIFGTETISADMIRRENLILYGIQKREVESADYTRVTHLFGELAKAGQQGRGKVGLAFAYDNDPRELYEIPEVVSYVKKIFELCPHLIYFLLPDQVTVKTFLFCLADAKISSITHGTAHLDVDRQVFAEIAAKIIRNVMEYGASIGDSDGAAEVLDTLGF